MHCESVSTSLKKDCGWKTKVMNIKLSSLAAIVSILATLPQAYKTIQTGLLRDHHPLTPVIAIFANTLLAIHGYQQKDIGILIFGIWFVLYNSLLNYYKSKPASSSRDE